MADGVYDLIVADIRTGELNPGDALRDRDVAETLGISRTPVREAVQRLERAGLLDVWPGRQTRVRVFSPSDTARLHVYFGEVCGLHLRFLLENEALAAKECTALDEAVSALEVAGDSGWGEAFTALMERVSKSAASVWSRMLSDHLPLLSLALRTLPEPSGDRETLSTALATAVANRAGAEAEATIRSLFGASR